MTLRHTASSTPRELRHTYCEYLIIGIVTSAITGTGLRCIKLPMTTAAGEREFQCYYYCYIEVAIVVGVPLYWV